MVRGPLDCDICGIGFKTRDELTSHAENFKPNPCNLCNRVFCSELDLVSHTQTDHPGRVQPIILIKHPFPTSEECKNCECCKHECLSSKSPTINILEFNKGRYETRTVPYSSILNPLP